MVRFVRRHRTVAVLTLLLLSLLALVVGRFVQFHDTSGAGSEREVLVLGPVAALLAGGAVWLAVPDRRARRTVGAALVVLDVVVVVLADTLTGFRFVWSAYEGELVEFEFLLGTVALFLLAPAHVSSPEPSRDDPHPARTLTVWARLVLYATALLLAMFVAFIAGTAYAVQRDCSAPDFGGECDLAAIDGVLWVGVVLVLGLVAIIIAEVAHARTRRRGRNRRSSGVT